MEKGFCAALTGGIACGKSVVAEFWRRWGAETLDADDMAHALIALFAFSMDLTLAHPELGPGRFGLERALDLLFRGLAASAERPLENPS